MRTTTRPTSVWSAVIGRAAVAGLALLGAAQSLSASPFLHLYGSCRAVRDMAVDGDRLWLATSGGLVLYREGSEPKIYSVVNDMKDIDLTSMVLESTDRIWLGSTDGHVIEFNPRTERFTAYNSLAYVGWDIACMRPFGPYLLLGSRKGLSVFSRSAKRALWNATRFGALVESSVRAIETAGDTIALVLPSGVAWLKAPDLRLVNLNDPGVWTTVPADTSAAAIIDGAGVRPHKWRIRRQGPVTFELRDTICKFLWGTDSIPYDTVTTLLRNDSAIFTNAPYIECAAEFGGDVYPGTRDSAMYRLHPVPPDSVTLEHKPLNSPLVPDIRQAAIDRSGTLWFMTSNTLNGVGRFAGGTWDVITQESDSAPGFGMIGGGRQESMNRVMVTTTDDVWVGTASYGAKWYNRKTGTWKNYIDTVAPSPSRFFSPLARFDAGLGNWWTFVGSICEDSTGRIWLGQERAYNDYVIHVFDPVQERWRTLAKEAYGFGGIYVRALAAARSPAGDTQYVYAGLHEQENGGGFGFAVIRFTDAIDGALSVTHAIPPSSVHDIAVTNSAVVWVATSSGLFRMRDSDVRLFRQIQRVRPSSPLYTVAISPAGHVVFAMDGDLWEYRDSVDRRDSLINMTRSGLLGTDVYDICSEPSAGRYWISTGKGLFRFATGEYVQPPLTDYSSVVAYPNPLSRTKRAPEVFFDHLVKDSRVTVYDVAGMMVWRSGPEDVQGSTSQMIRWDGRNAGGALVRPGTYYYHIHTTGGKRLVGKLLVIP